MKFLIISLTIINIICFDGFGGVAQGRLILNSDHIIDSASSIVRGLGSQVLKKLLSPKDFLRESKQWLFGLPEVAILKTIHELCSLYLSSANIDPKITPDIGQMYFQLRTPCGDYSFPIESAEEILSFDQFNINQSLVLFISGWTSTIESDNIVHMAKAYNCRGGYNFLALNASHFIDTLYTWSAFNTDSVGRIVADGLVQLYKGVPAQNIHIIGFSLGAHIAGFASRYFEKYTGEKVQRITGLDPANPCFDIRSFTGLQRGDAKFVDVMHTNPGAFGESNPLGDIDFYVQGFAPIKPGCKKIGCSHMKAWEYYAESVYPGHEMDFLATMCRSPIETEYSLCNENKIIMGLYTPFSGKGTYILNVNSKLPYGENARYNNELILSQCGFCDF